MSLSDMIKVCRCGQTFHAEHANHEFCNSDCREKMRYDAERDKMQRDYALAFVDDPIRCPKCDSKSKLVWSKMRIEGRVRRRACRNRECRHRWFTVEAMRT